MLEASLMTHLIEVFDLTKQAHAKILFACRVESSTPEIVEAIAKELGCLRVNGEGKLVGAAGVLLDRIAQGQLQIVASDNESS